MGRKLDRRIQFRRYAEEDDGYSVAKKWADHGARVWAKKTDISDAERFRDGEVSASITTRFLVRYSVFTRDISPKDTLVCDGVIFDIIGIKEVSGRRRWLEITTSMRAE